jgi:hypothetical protein
MRLWTIEGSREGQEIVLALTGKREGGAGKHRDFTLYRKSGAVETSTTAKVKKKTADNISSDTISSVCVLCRRS